ncbi:MAG: hypothetical protein PHU46_12015 [Rhodocyclaceae bacterium]|nr:hypothetical protein [Rhodocyclaceae bacterium]
MIPRTQSHPQPGAPAPTLAEITTQAWEAVARLAAAGHTVRGMLIEVGSRPRITLEPSPRLAHLAFSGDEAIWVKSGIRAGQAYRVGQLDFPGVVVTWKEIVGSFEMKRRAA